MKFTTHSRTIVTLSLATLISAPTAFALQADKDAATALTTLIDPPAAGTQQDQAPSLAVMKQVVKDLITQGSAESIALFGESAGPALRAIAVESSLDALTRNSNSNPIYYLTTSAPMAGLEFFSDLERSSKFQYEALVRGQFAPMNLLGSAATVGASSKLYLDLLDRTISSESLDLSARLKMAVGSLSSGLSTPLSRSLVEQNAERAIKEWRNWSESTLEVVLPTPESITADLPEVIAHAALTKRKSIETFEALASSPHVEVREEIARALGMDGSEWLRPIDRRLALLYQLSGDALPYVANRADESILEILRFGSVQLDIETVTELLATVGSKTSIGSNMSQKLAEVVHTTASAPGPATPAQVEALYRTTFASPNRELSQWLTSGGSIELPIDRSVAFFTATSKASEKAHEFALRSVASAINRKPSSSPQFASSVLDMLLSEAMEPGEEATFLGAISDVGNQSRSRVKMPERSVLLSALPSDRVGEALLWLAAHSPEFGVMAFESPWAWKDAGAQMRAVLVSSESSTRAKLIAGAGLVNSGARSKADRDAMTQLLIDLCKNPAGYEDVKWFIGNNRSGSGSRASLYWDSLTAAILQDRSVSDSIATEFMLSSALDSAEHKVAIQAVLEAAEQRVIQSKGAVSFDKLTYRGVRAMLADPTLLQPNLMHGWILNESQASSDMISVVIASGDENLIEVAMNHLLAGIAASSSHFKSIPMANQLLRLPGDEPVQRLLEVTLRSGSAEFVSAVEKRMAERLRIREAALRWSDLAGGGTSIDSAKARVLQLLDSPNSDVRIEAIYGLGTLGAIEALPRLIEVVGSGNQAEREAAKTTLKLLRMQAVNAKSQAATADKEQSPNVK